MSPLLYLDKLCVFRSLFFSPFFCPRPILVQHESRAKGHIKRRHFSCSLSLSLLQHFLVSLFYFLSLLFFPLQFLLHTRYKRQVFWAILYCSFSIQMRSSFYTLTHTHTQTWTPLKKIGVTFFSIIRVCLCTTLYVMQ